MILDHLVSVIYWSLMWILMFDVPRFSVNWYNFGQYSTHTTTDNYCCSQSVRISRDMHHHNYNYNTSNSSSAIVLLVVPYDSITSSIQCSILKVLENFSSIIIVWKKIYKSFLKSLSSFIDRCWPLPLIVDYINYCTICWVF